MPRPTILVKRSARQTHSMSTSRSQTTERTHLLYCYHCTKRFASDSARAHHISVTPACRAAEAVSFERERKRKRVDSPLCIPQDTLDEATLVESANHCPRLQQQTSSLGSQPTQTTPSQSPSQSRQCNQTTHPSQPSYTTQHRDGNTPQEPHPKRGVFVETFPDPQAGAPISDERMPPPDLDAYMKARGVLGDPEHFETAELMMTTGLTDGAKDRHLKSSKYRGSTPWVNCEQLLQDVDQLPHGPEWEIIEVKIPVGNETRVQYMYRRNVIHITQELIGDPGLKNDMHYVAVRQYTSKDKKSRIINEMWTADWWWRMQQKLGDKGAATIAALILASDKTNLSIICGGQQAYPVYVTLGNISKSTRRKLNKRATVLLGYLPIDDFEDIEDAEERRRLKGELVHRSMEHLLEPLKTASVEGVDMWCADGRLRRVYPMIAAFVADWPEQNLMACTKEGSCPVCKTKREGRGDHRQSAPLRERGETLEALMAYFDNDNDPGELEDLSLKPVWPWWATIPGVNLSACITPDLLHQLYQGIFKTHLLKWLRFLLGDDVIDDAFKAMPRAEGMRHFTRGITTVKQWTGRESKEMAKQVLPVVVGMVSPEITRMVRAVIDFIYRAHAASMTDKDIDALEESLSTLHELKDLLVTKGYYEGAERFDMIPKLHMMGHYAHSIRELGTPDGYNTEGPEHLHIEYAKKPWRASNKRRPLPQMTKYIQRLEAIRIQRRYINAYYNIGEEVEPDEDDEDGPLDNEGAQTVGHTEGMETEEYSDADPSSVSYPQQWVHTVKTPTRCSVLGKNLMRNYGTTELFPSIVQCLSSKFHARPEDIRLSPNDLFDVWHRLYLHHDTLPFSPLEPARRDVIRVRPMVLNKELKVTQAGLFDTALVLDSAVQERPRTNSPQKFGISRYRAARVRAIFTLPDHLKDIHNGQLAYLELFTPFPASVSPFHQMSVTRTDLRPNGTRRTAVVPITDIVLACHLAPQFHRLNGETKLTASSDLLSTTTHFYLNHYYSHYIYQFMSHWRRKSSEQRERLNQLYVRE